MPNRPFPKRCATIVWVKIDKKSFFQSLQRIFLTESIDSLPIYYTIILRDFENFDLGDGGKVGRIRRVYGRVGGGAVGWRWTKTPRLWAGCGVDLMAKLGLAGEGGGAGFDQNITLRDRVAQVDRFTIVGNRAWCCSCLQLETGVSEVLLGDDDRSSVV